MNIAVVLLKQILLMFILMGIGFLFFRKKMISVQGSADLGKILLYLVVPLVIINSFWTERTPQKTAELMHSAVIAAVSMAAAVIISSLVFGRKKGISCFSSAFSNAGFIGIPLVSAVLGQDAVFYISVMIVLINGLQWTYGVYTISGDASVMNPGAIIRNPIVLSVLAGLVIYFFNIPQPAFVSSLFSTIIGLNTPLAMIVSGVYLAQSDLKAMLKKKEVWETCLFRLVLIPLVTLLLFRIIPFGSVNLKLAVMIAAACPVGSNVAIFAQQYQKDYRLAVEEVCMSTILCLITLPAMIMLASAVL